MSTATITVGVDVGKEYLVSTADVEIRPKPTAGVLLGSLGATTAQAPYEAPAGAEPFALHGYTGPNPDGTKTLHWNQPVSSRTRILNMRPLAKPDVRVTASVVQSVLRGEKNWVWDAIIAEVRKWPQTFLGTVWHEPLVNLEFLVGENLLGWSDVFIYVMNRFELAGVHNVRWYSCLTASQYKSPGGAAFHSSDLLAKLDGVGADVYFTKGTPSPDTDTTFQAFAAYQPLRKHAVLETGLWSDPTHYGTCYDDLDLYYKAHPNWTALFGFFAKASDTKDGRLSPEGQVVWDRMAKDPFYSRDL